MVDEIIQGDNGTVMQATINDDNGVVDIRGSQIVFTVLSPTGRYEKQGTVVDGINGIAEFILDSENVQDIGNYAFQGTVIFSSGSKFSSDIKKFKVGRKL